MNNVKGLVGLSFSRGSFISKGIRWFRKFFVEDKDKDFIPSHAFIVQGTLNDEIIISESTNPKMRTHPLRTYMRNTNKKFELWEIEGTDEEEVVESLRQLMVTYSGKTYGYLQLFGYIWITLNKLFGRKVDNLTQGEREVVCSEYTFFHLQNIGYDESELMSMNQNNIAPDSIRTSFRKSKRAKLVAVKDYDTDKIIWIED